MTDDKRGLDAAQVSSQNQRGGVQFPHGTQQVQVTGPRVAVVLPWRAATPI